ncbi:hypothetical protein CI109_103760 [Kwoniella shandongensis]|uniref:Uncharacterized protein n=1 Tax=Kwoniella shandongensis TaxID=1734106 RepID=A0A5M6C7W4_9TREE|nr:uncharacterized protein CI109_000543 [Kwoniella shandongensis]KAA5530971.1 hypothetical protein CI109_000543 [Kwoniella shandongensis]
MKVFTTNGTGWIGSHVVPILLAKGYEVTALARSEESAKKLEAQGVTVLRGDLQDTEVLSKGASEADAVLHLAYNHDFTKYGKESAELDFAAIKALAGPLEGTDKPLVITTAVGTPRTPRPLETEQAVDDITNPRGRAELVAAAYATKRVRVINMRLPYSVHGDNDPGFITLIVQAAKKHGFSAYIGEGTNLWSAVHVDDAAKLFLAAIETPADKFPSNPTSLHGVGDEGIPTREIAKTIGDKLGFETKSIPQSDAISHFGFVGAMFATGSNPSRALTTEWTGWEPRGKGLLEDIKTGTYIQ